MALTDRIAELITPTLESMGYELVRVQMTGTRTNQTLQIMAERMDDTTMTVDDCGSISHTVSAQLDVADPIASAYSLEVSSPGVDRPLTRLKDFARFAGFEAKVQLTQPHNGQRNFRGMLRGVDGQNVLLESEPAKKGEAPATHAFPFAAIDQAKLVMNDALMKAALNAQKQNEANQNEQKTA